MPASAPSRSRRRFLALLPVTALALSLTACGGDSDAPKTGTSAADLDKALQQPTTLTFWTWVPNIQKTVDLFEKKYPKVKVKVVNAGQSAAEYTKLQTALKAGSGGPDVAQVEYFALPQFALAKQLVNLNDYGADKLKDTYAASAWSQVNVNGGVYGLPQDTGPLAMFYREDVLKKYDIEPPKTWAEYEKAAEKLHQADPKSYIASMDPGDAGVVSMLWQAGSRPFQTKKGTDVTVDLADKGATQWSQMSARLLEKKLVDPQPGWTNEWWRAMSTGKYAMWITGAWAPANIASTLPDTMGKWRAAPVPQWNEGDHVSAENGGSSTVVPTTSKNKAAAVAFNQWLSSDPEAIKSLNANGLFPATKQLLQDPAFLDTPLDVFGGQKANKIFADSSAQVGTGWQYLPYQVYANSVFKDTVGQKFTAYADPAPGFAEWQSRIADYGKEQGFNVTAK
ncbi:ABC transporter substrate-binding protein [Streptomyces sp. NPDC126933]|uniref:ABC transporter substrate-binding protein n=1 Tax=unclassified Streptomyces TaxID=2593676 RepID=UPI00365F8014